MPELNKAAPTNTDPVVPASAKVAPPVSTPAKRDAPTSPSKADTGDAVVGSAAVPVAVRPKVSPLVIALGATSAILLIVAVILGNKISALNTAAIQSQNHASQQEGETSLMVTQLADAKAGAIKLQQQVDDANAGAAQLKSQVDDAKLRSTEIEAQLEKTRAASNGFQSQMEEAKVASIRYQGEMELAKTQATLMKAQLVKATADTARVQSQLDESRTRSDTLQAKLATAEKEIAELKKPRPKT
jgi:hypothetical protein